MRFKTPLLAHLGKAGKGASKPESNDTDIIIAGQAVITIQPPLPFFSLLGADIASAPNNSWIMSQLILFNANINVDMITIGPGLWRLQGYCDLVEKGAVSDPTNTFSLLLTNLDASGATIGSQAIVNLTNKQGVLQHNEFDFSLTVSADSLFKLTKSTAVGLGTALNLMNIRVIASKYL